VQGEPGVTRQLQWATAWRQTLERYRVSEG
jgi:hypothetical protein